MKRFRRALKQSVGLAFGSAAGVTLGGVIGPRLVWPDLYGGGYPPLLSHAVVYFGGGFILSLIITTGIYYLREGHKD